MRKIAEYKQIDTRLEQRVIHHNETYDEEGNIVVPAYDETIEVSIPVMGMIYRDTTPEEEAKFVRQHAEMPEPEPTAEERLDALEDTTDDMILLMADLIGGM